MSAAQLFDFSSGIVRSLSTAYAPLVERRRHAPYGEAERQLQLRRRGRYVEFNLLHDRGTHFGLQTDARAESVLMSLPQEAAWTYSSDDTTDPLESALTAMLVPRDWVGKRTDAPRSGIGPPRAMIAFTDQSKRSSLWRRTHLASR